MKVMSNMKEDGHSKSEIKRKQIIGKKSEYVRCNTKKIEGWGEDGKVESASRATPVRGSITEKRNIDG